MSSMTAAEDHARFLALQGAEFLQHARGDAGRSGDESSGDEQRFGPVEARAVRPQRTEYERHDHAEHADQKGAAADALHFVEPGFQSNREQQQHNADFGKHVQCLGRLHPAEHGRPDHAAGGDFADHARQLQALRDFRADLGGDEDDEQAE
jgi:hypothetical protein